MNSPNVFFKIAEKLKILFMNFTKKYTKTKMSVFSSHIGSEISKLKELKMKNEIRLINANEIVYCNYDLDNYHSFRAVTDDEIDEMPTVDAIEVKHGIWETIDGSFTAEFHCSVCGGWKHNLAYKHEGMNYCPNCGAKMDAR